MFASAAAGAQAGRYHVYSCRMPDGEAAPVDGWSPSFGPDRVWDDYLEDTCEKGGALMAALGDETPHLAVHDYASWAFQVPTYDSLLSAVFWRAGDTALPSTNLYTYQYWLSSPSLYHSFDWCLSNEECKGKGNESLPSAIENEVVVPPADLGSGIFVSAGCGGADEPEPYECPAGKGDANNYAAAIYLFAADFTLEQTAGPSVGGVGGELADASKVAGTSDLLFSASDPGSGVYEAVFSVDGNVVQRQVIDEAGGRCRDVGQTSDGLPAFLYLQPCPASVSADVGFDTGAVANGTHHLVVSVTDAAGNSVVALDRTLDVENPGAPGPPNGQGASYEARLQARWKSTPRMRLLAPFGRREMIVGRLTGPDGAPIVGAQITLTDTLAMSGAQATDMPAVRTGPGGEFTVHLPAGLSSRSVSVAYFARIGDARAAAGRTLDLAVRAPVSLRISPRSAGVGTTIHFQGRLDGGPIPPGGKPLVLEARSGGGRWIEFDVLRTDSRGRYRASYTFRFPGPVLYQFRVLCEQEADYPYAGGASPVLDVSER